MVRSAEQLPHHGEDGSDTFTPSPCAMVPNPPLHNVCGNLDAVRLGAARMNKQCIALRRAGCRVVQGWKQRLVRMWPLDGGCARLRHGR